MIVQVKSKLWIAHSNGRKHLENVAALKKKSATAKRPHDSVDSAVPTKKAKDQISSRSSNGNSASTSDTVENMEWIDSETKSKTKEKNLILPRLPVGKILEGVPEGFFDDKKLNNRVAETIEKDAKMEKEFANFMIEIDEAKRIEDEREEHEDESHAKQRDLDQIDEHIDFWKRINHLEIKREDLLSQNSKPIENSTSTVDITEDESEMDDIDLDDLTNWRRKRLV